MSINFQRVVGWLLLLGGVVMIFYMVYVSYNIFMGKMAAPDIFSSAGLAKNIQTSGNIKTPVKNVSQQSQLEQVIQDQLGKVVGDALKNVLPGEVIFKILDLISWSIFASIIFFAGAQIAGLGIKLLNK